MSAEKKRSGVKSPRRRGAPAERLTIKIRVGEKYSRAMSPEQAGAFTGMTGESMRALVRRMAGSSRTVEFDGVLAIKVGTLWRIRLDERWVETEKPSARADRRESDMPSEGHGPT